MNRRVGWGGTPFARLLFLSVVLFTAIVGCRQGEPDIPGVPSGTGVLYADDFSPAQIGDWLLEGDEAGQALVVEEQLVLEVNAPNTIHYATLESVSFPDYVLEVDVTQWAGSLDSTYGVLFRRSGPDQFYRFALTGSGLYMVERYDGEGRWTRLIPEWEEAPSFNQGLDQTNSLALRVSGSTFSFYANDRLLTEVTDGRYGTGNIALSAGTFGQPGLRVAFDNFVILRP